VPFSAGRDGYYVFTGIGRYARLLEPKSDYTIEAGELVLKRPAPALVDIYAGCAWPDRFDRPDLARRRKRTRTINAWDSQYMLAAKPMHEMRLDADRLRVYAEAIRVERANREVRLMLGEVQMAGASTYWDCALGRPTGDTSAFTIVFTDERGQLYWHVSAALTGDIEVVNERTGELTGGQCKQILDLVVRYQLPRVTVETNGPGGFVPPILRKHLAGTGCGVMERVRTSTMSKNKLILDAIEAPLSGRFLWAHVDIAQGPAADEMRDWNPALTDQPDSYIDSLAGAIRETPIRIGKPIGEAQHVRERREWRPDLSPSVTATWDDS
jgi:hypothetical protein